MKKSTENCLNPVNRLKKEIETADAIVIGAGAGLSAAAGMDYSGKRFEDHFGDFQKKYGITDMYSGGFYPFSTPEEFWAWWSRHILINRYEAPVGEVYKNLLKLVEDKNYFVITTNVDHQFQRAGFDKKRLFYTQGDYGLFQCSVPCHKEVYDNEEIVRQMAEQQKDMKIPSNLIPVCPVCGEPMTVNLRIDQTFVQDEGWYKAASRYENFLQECEGKRVLYLELGVGGNTPGIIKYPFWQMTAENPKAWYACITKNDAVCPAQIADQSICIDGDIDQTIRELLIEKPDRTCEKTQDSTGKESD